MLNHNLPAKPRLLLQPKTAFLKGYMGFEFESRTMFAQVS